MARKDKMEREPEMNVYPPMRWVKYENGVMVLQVLTNVGAGSSAWLNVPVVDALSVYGESSAGSSETAT